jgi:hypothetical protein
MGQQRLNRAVLAREFPLGQHGMYLPVAYAVQVNRLAPTFAFGHEVVCIPLGRWNEAAAQGTGEVCG